MRPRTSMTILLAGITLASLPALALDVGTATAVNPLSQSTPPGGSLVALTVGARIVHNERIQTTSNGTVQLLFLDKSSLSIGPSSNILIDNFVYNPNAGTGHMATTLAKGVIRFVGGQLSHQGEAVVNTPVSAIGIRGGTTTISHGANGTRVINHFGIITIQNGCGTVVIRRSGFAVNVLNWNTCPSEPERVTEAEIAQYLKILTSQLNGQNGGVPGLRNAMIEGLDFGGLIGPNTAPILGNGESSAFQLIIQATQLGTGRTPPPPAPPPPVQPIITTPTIVTTTTTTPVTTPVTTTTPTTPTTTFTTTIFRVLN